MEKSAVFISQPDWMVKEALGPLATGAARYGGQGFRWLAKHTPKLLKRQISVPARNAAGTWTKGTGTLMENLGKFGGKHLKNTRASGFFDDLVDLGGQANRFGVRQKAVADTLWKPSNYSKWYHYANPLKWVNSLSRNALGAGLTMDPTLGTLYYGPGLVSTRGGLAATAAFGAMGPIGNALDTSYRYTPIQRDPMMPMRNLRYQDVLRSGRKAIR